MDSLHLEIGAVMDSFQRIEVWLVPSWSARKKAFSEEC